MDNTSLTILIIYLLSVFVTGFAAFRAGRQWQSVQNTKPQAAIACGLVIVLLLFALPFGAKVATMAIGWVFSLLVLSAWTFLVGAISKGGTNKQ
ncbi:MAG: hypothetical protein IPJ49_21045 [Candidatus Obscuribacter sp.]|nr:hypothetical protein [Candidatus Obscuribacter sp.]